MKIQCRFIFDYPNSKSANIIFQSLDIDNMDFLKSWVHGRQMEAKIYGLSITSVLHTINDFLACLTVAEQVTIRP